MLDNKQAQALLARSIGSHVFEIVGRSALLTAALALVDYLGRPKAFTFADVWITFIVVVVFHAILTLLFLVLAAARYRERPKRWDDD